MGDILMAMPAMREGDFAVAKEQHQFGGAPVSWMSPGPVPLAGVTWPAMRRDRHTTDAWLEATARPPVRHALMPTATKHGIVIAPAVAAEAKQWPWERWGELMAALSGSRLLDEKVSRADWMRALNEAETVICPDTGTAHVADALGCPRVIALHGVPANWPHCAPYWDRRYCIARDSMAEITVNDVLEMVDA